MTVPGTSLLMPLRALTPTRPAFPRTLRLDEPARGGVSQWAGRVRDADEPCLLIDAEGRVAAASRPCGELLSVEPLRIIGALLADLLEMIDFSAAGVPLADPARHAPPLRALSTGGMARGLVRLRPTSGPPVTYDVVGIPLAGGSGALAFFTIV